EAVCPLELCPFPRAYHLRGVTKVINNLKPRTFTGHHRFLNYSMKILPCVVTEDGLNVPPHPIVFAVRRQVLDSLQGFDHRIQGIHRIFSKGAGIKKYGKLCPSIFHFYTILLSNSNHFILLGTEGEWRAKKMGLRENFQKLIDKKLQEIRSLEIQTREATAYIQALQ